MIFGFLTAWGLTRRLGRLASAAQAWSRGDFSVVIKDRSKDEIGQLSRELNAMAAQLEHLIQARGSSPPWRPATASPATYDSVKQQVFATSLQVAAAWALIGDDTEAAEAHLAQADELVRQAQKELNVLIQEMRPAALEGKGSQAPCATTSRAGRRGRDPGRGPRQGRTRGVAAGRGALPRRAGGPCERRQAQRSEQGGG